MNTIDPDVNMCRTVMNTLIQWHVDKGLTRRINILADATMFDVGLLEGQVNGLHQIVLNIAGQATQGFTYSEHAFSFHCGYQGQDVFLVVPYEAVLGFIIPTGEETVGFFPIPNMERELLSLKLIAAAREMRETHPIKPEPYAVHGITLDTHDGDGNIMPTIEDLMLAKNRAPAKPVKLESVPLLDFGPIGGKIIQPVSRYKGPPTLTLIQGGKR